MKKFLIVNKNDFFKKKIKNNNKNKFYFISNNKHLTINKIKKINPNIIFFPHWSWIISEKILKEYLCIGFHSTPLPYGRGGSPIQNMILRGFKKTSICAFKIEKNLDEMTSVLNEKVTSIVDQVSNSSEKLDSAVQNQLKNVDEMIKNMSDAQQEALKEINDTLLSQIKGLDESMEKEVTRIIELMGTKLF